MIFTGNEYLQIEYANPTVGGAALGATQVFVDTFALCNSFFKTENGIMSKISV